MSAQDLERKTLSSTAEDAINNSFGDRDETESIGSFGRGSSDAGDSSNAIEVVFDPHLQARRRKSSMVGPNFKTSSCFVHSLLEAQRLGRLEKKEVAPQAKETAAQTILGAHSHEPIDPLTGGASSRLLTKRQLSEMALGVRELSKHLANLRMKLPNRRLRILVVTKIHDETLIDRTRDLVEWVLSNFKDYVMYIEDNLKSHHRMRIPELLSKVAMADDRLRYWTPKFCTDHPQLFDLVITLGGDGTVLYASWLFQKVVPPVLSFALGSLGFLTKFDFKKYQTSLSDVFQHGVTITLRMRFECTVMQSIKKDGVKSEKRDLTTEIVEPEIDNTRTHHPIASYSVLNELVVDRGPNPTMSSTELYGDEQHLTTIQADGICIATPTGSTAYSLAAGGSLCHPDNPVMLVSPICAHSLSFRPLILPDAMILRVGVPYDSRATAWASFDGKERIELNQGDYVTIAASRFPFATVQSKEHQGDFFDSLSRTLQWNSRSRQKAFDDDQSGQLIS